tara:strand:+ start:555 stop:1019 length:465 start_codon:yes stop_codon:yes gene_type:complete
LLETIFKIFKNSDDQNTENKSDDLTILCGLMIEAANTDGKLAKEEIEKISQILINNFRENSEDVNKTLKIAIENKDEPKSLHYYTSKINKNFETEKKLIIIETLWEVILSDGEIHDFESNLIRRLAGLLYISDVSCGNAKRKALEKINITKSTE